MATTTLDQYNFRQQRRRSPDLKDPVIKQETKPQAAQQQQQGILSSTNTNCKWFKPVCPAKECFFCIADHSEEENDIQTLKAFDLDYVYGPAVGKYNLVLGYELANL